MDLSKLTDEQLALAEKLLPMAKLQKVPLTEKMLSVAEAIAQESKKQGVNPDYVFPLVMQESGFDQSAISKKGATGVMQLMPDTAKSLGVDPNDQAQNIKGGVTFLKKLLTHENIQGDPYKVLMGYNAGPNSKFFHTGDIKDLPDETLNYADRIRELSGGVLPVASIDAAPSTAVALPAVPAAAPAGATTEKEVEPASLNPLIGAAVGAPLGVSTGTAAATYKAQVDAARAAYEYAQAQRAAKAAAVEGVTPQSGGQKWLKNYANLDRPEFTGGVPEAAQTYQRSKPQGKVTSKLYKKFGNMPLNIAAQPAEGVAGQALEEAGKGASFGKYLRGLGSLPVKAGMFGATAGLGAVDALNRHWAKDDTGAAISGLGTAAALAAPYVGSMGALPAASIAAPLYLMASDRIKRLAKHPEEVQLQEDNFDPLGMPIR